jgi:hypothetical protein
MGAITALPMPHPASVTGAPREARPVRLAEMEPATTTDAITVIEHASFAVSDRSGDITPGSYHGFFAADTRFLSRLTLRIAGKRPEPLWALRVVHGAATL